jgi:hypothetical protein
MLLLVTYAVAGSRCEGVYAIDAPTKKVAKQTIKAIDSDYVKVKPFTMEEWGDDGGWEDLMDGVELQEGKYEQLCCGT